MTSQHLSARGSTRPSPVDAGEPSPAPMRHPLVLLGMGGPESHLRLATQLGREHGAVVTLAHVLDTRLPWWGGSFGSAAYVEAVRHHRRAGVRALAEARDWMPEDVLVRTCILHGDANVESQVRAFVARGGHDGVLASVTLADSRSGRRILRGAGVAFTLADGDGERIGVRPARERGVVRWGLPARLRVRPASPG